MRFIVSVGLFFLAAVLITLGMFFRTIWGEQETMTKTIAVPNSQDFTLVDLDSLRSIAKTVEFNISDSMASGSTATSSNIFLVWGRKPDVLAWMGDVSHTVITGDPKTGELASKSVSGLADFSNRDFNSDLWIQFFQGQGALNKEISTLPDCYALIASDGWSPAPANVEVTWKYDVDYTVSNRLFFFGILMGVAGLILFILGWWEDNRKHRHRQGRMPMRPRQRRWKPPRGPLAPRRRKGRRALGFISVFGVSAVLLSGCVSPSSTTPTPIPSPTESDDGTYVSVVPEQFDRIYRRLIGVLDTADNSLLASDASERLAGAAFRFRSAEYTVKKTDKSLVDLFNIPDGNVRLLLPQQTDTWPRSVFAIIDNKLDPKAPSIAVVMTQESALENYKLVYYMGLEPGVKIPPVATPAKGTTVLPSDTQVLMLTPTQAAVEYGDVLQNGENSEYAFQIAPDSLQEQVGSNAKAKRTKQLEGTAKFEWKQSLTEDAPLVFATLDAGAIVAITLQESEIVRPAGQGAAISATGAVKALAGRDASLIGLEADYQYQLLLYVPSIGSASQIRLLGYSYALVAAKEIQ